MERTSTHTHDEYITFQNDDIAFNCLKAIKKDTVTFNYVCPACGFERKNCIRVADTCHYCPPSMRVGGI